MSGHVDQLSEKQAAALKQLRENVADILKPYHDDVYLLRWLRARSFVLKKAEKMLRENIKWRRKIGADTLLDDWVPPEVLQKHYAGGLSGHDKTGSPIWIEPTACSDLKGIFHSAKKSDIIKFKVTHCETIWKDFETQAQKLGRKVDEIGLVVIFDLENYGLDHLWKPAVSIQTEILSIFEAYYPETLKKSYIINAPWIFPIAYNIFKVFISEDTRRKMVVLGSNWKDHLLEDIDADQLPVYWGGSATGPDGNPYCTSKINMGGKVPFHYYIDKRDALDQADFTKVTIGRGSCHQVARTVSKPGSVIRWEFSTEGKDIGCGLFRLKDKHGNGGHTKVKHMEELRPIERVNCHLVPEDGSYSCDQPGEYVLHFDNSFSWVSSKKLSFLVEVLEEDSMEGIPKTASFAHQLSTHSMNAQENV